MVRKVKKDQTIDVADTKETIENVKEFIGGKEHYDLIDFGGSFGLTREGRDLNTLSKHIKKNGIAKAFLMKSNAVKLVSIFLKKSRNQKLK